jgi:PAS domain S-box/PAS domain S-box/PAS domain S-box
MKVLIAGVRPEIQEKVDRYLNGLATEREYASTPRDTLNSLKGDDVDVVILGPLIVNKNPGQALGKIRAIAPRSSVIYIADVQDEGEALELIRLGAAEVLSVEELSAHNLTRTVGRVAERALASVQMISQISDFVLTHSFDGIVALDLQNRIVLWNHAMERMFGRKRQEVLGRVANDVLPFEGLEREFSLAAAGRSFAGERKSYITRGERRYYQPYYSPLHNRSGSIIGVMANFRDLTEGHEKDRMLTDLKARVMQLADTIPGMVWMAGHEGTRDAFNKKWLQFTGSNQESLRFDGWLVGMHPQDRARFHSVYDKALADKTSFHVEYRMRRHDKMYRRLLDSGTPVFGNDGAFLGFIGSCTDISESGTTQYRIDASAVPRAPQEGPSETTFVVDASTTMENAPIGVWKLDKDLVVTKASRAVAEQLGVSANELVGQLFHEIVASVPREPFVAVLENEESVQISAHKVEFGEGPERRSFFWDLTAWPLKDKDNQVIGVCVSTMEVDDRNSLDKQKEDFIATLVHDLKTPLIGADRTLELIINGTLGDVDESQSEILSMLRRSNQGLLRMVQNLIEVSRFDFSKPNLAFEATSLFDLASECARELMAYADQKNISIEVNLAPNQGDVQVDTLAVRRVVLNLLDNAIKFTPSGGNIKVWGEETPNQVTIHVKDTGIGIAENELQKVFERFWRSEKGKGQAVGTGLGLYLCQQIVDAHQGDITVSSTEGTGTTFSVVLPRH